MVLDKRPFGTQEDVYREGYEWMHHSVAPKVHADQNFRVTIGGPDCTRPYSASVFNISAMSFGALSPNAVRALNAGAKKGGFAHDTGEGGVSPYHRENGGDLIWEIGSGYFGCRNHDGSFNPEEFARVAGDDQIKMVELKSARAPARAWRGAAGGEGLRRDIEDPGGLDGRGLYLAGVTPGVFDAAGNDGLHRRDAPAVRRQAGRVQALHRASLGIPGDLQGDDPDRNLSDFIVVDGNEGGTGAAPLEFMDHLGMPMREGVNFVHNALVGINARDRIRVGRAARSPPLSTWPAPWRSGPTGCNSARGFMFSLGCIQSLSCHTDRCPTGVTTQDPSRNRALVVPHKTERVYNYHHATLHALAELLAAAGLDHPQTSGRFISRNARSTTEVRTFAQLYPSLRPGELIDGTSDPRFREAWAMARAETFSMVG